MTCGVGMHPCEQCPVSGFFGRTHGLPFSIQQPGPGQVTCGGGRACRCRSRCCSCARSRRCCGRRSRASCSARPPTAPMAWKPCRHAGARCVPTAPFKFCETFGFNCSAQCSVRATACQRAGSHRAQSSLTIELAFLLSRPCLEQGRGHRATKPASIAIGHVPFHSESSLSGTPKRANVS